MTTSNECNLHKVIASSTIWLGECHRSEINSEDHQIQRITRHLCKHYGCNNCCFNLALNCLNTPTIFKDNIGDNYICENSVFHTKMKHLAIDSHFVCDHVAKKELQLSHIPSIHQLANLFKPYSTNPFCGA